MIERPRFRWPRERESVPAWIRAGGRAAAEAVRRRCDLAALHRLAKRWRYRHVRGPVIVYQMGRVGSVSVYRPLRARGLPHPVYHVHNLVGLDELERKIRAARARPALSLEQIARDREIARLIRSHPERRWNVVSLVREPVARHVSAFFQELDEYYPGIRAEYEAGRCDLDALRAGFWARHARHQLDAWFDEQLKPVFGIDVFAAPFPTERGYLVARRGRTTLLLIRLEDLERCVRRAFRDAFAIPDMRVGRDNGADERWYRDLYRRFLAELVVPGSYLDEVYRSRFARHFYTPEELARFRTRWTRGARH